MDPNVLAEKQVIKPVITKVREVLQIKQRLEQGKAALRCKIKTPITSPIAQTVGKPLKISEVPKMQDEVMTIPNFAVPAVQSKGNSSTNMINSKMIEDIAREIPIYQDPVYRPHPKPVKHLYLTFLEAYGTLTQD